jgi:hypothetical protein
MAETVKKATTPRKPRKVAPSKKKNVTPISTSYEQVAELAHRFWADRGGEHGHDAEDWFRAEQQLLGKAS